MENSRVVENEKSANIKVKGQNQDYLFVWKELFITCIFLRNKREGSILYSVLWQHIRLRRTNFWLDNWILEYKSVPS
jgi:hypothetical protein